MNAADFDAKVDVDGTFDIIIPVNIRIFHTKGYNINATTCETYNDNMCDMSKQTNASKKECVPLKNIYTV